MNISTQLAPAVAPFSARELLRSLRPHQWSKNLLVAMPMLCAHQIGNGAAWKGTVAAFVLFSIGASGQYQINDVIDREDDRRNPAKSQRPFASGTLSPAVGYLMGALLVAASLAGAAAIGAGFLVHLLAYHALAASYSWRLKRYAILDMLVLAGLYTLRVLAGGAATGITVSPWLLTFSLFFFLTLAVLKRFAEIAARDDLRKIRGYCREDLPLLRSIGIASGGISILVVAFYIQHPQVLLVYHKPERLWLLCPLLLYWISRLWLVASRGQMVNDPLEFTQRDLPSYAVAALAALTVWWAA